jgi:hypothetical protein
MPQRDQVADIHQRVDGRQGLVAQHAADQGLDGRAELAGLRTEGPIRISPGLDPGVLRQLLDAEPAPDRRLGIAQRPDQFVRRCTIDHVVGNDDTPHIAWEALKDVGGDGVG